jgi:carboxyl-terminal processing protease
MISGTEGTKVTLTVIRPSVSPTATFDVMLTRGKFVSPTVASYIIPGENIDDILLYQFSSDADAQIAKAIKAAEAAHVKGIVLDLRENPGGLLEQATAVSSEFIPKGKTVYIDKTRSGSTNQISSCGCAADQTPLEILVDNNTASAAEITAGAISINRPEVHLIGQTTFGTGTILTEFVLSDGSALWLGSDEWLLPNGQSVYHKGLTPDQPVALHQGVATLSPLVASQEKFTQQQVLSSGDSQLLQALKDLNG